MDAHRMGRFPLAHLPTPLEELGYLSKQLGRHLFIKRDDLTGLALEAQPESRLRRAE
jgi:1-aminocyclopropane-1-carboxylate deaminase/D-cysteine desulfhydrase-like pyridoxal-dependent ACC family enzyme